MPPTKSHKRRRSSATQWLIAGAIAGGLALAGLLVALSANDPPPLRTGRLSDQSTNAPATPDLPPTNDHLVDDPTGTLLWTSPTAGPPLSLAYVPAGTQCLVHLRPAKLAAHPEGDKVLAALGPWGQHAVARLRALTAAELAELDSLLIAIIVKPDGQLDASLRAQLAKPWDDAELARRLTSANEDRRGDQSFRIVGDRAYFLPRAASSDADEQARTLIVCPIDLAPELIDAAGEPPPLVRDVESLAQRADADRIATVIVVPKFLEASGVDLLTEAAAPLHDALHWLLGSSATAVALSAHWGEDFFIELRATPALNVPPRRLAATLAERIAAAPDAVEEQILAAPWHSYGRKVLARFPAMLRKLAGYARRGEEDKHALVRCYLPSIAGHNLLMGAELLLTQPHATPGESASAVESTPTTPTTITNRLAQTTSLSFAKDTLERALELLAEDIEIEIVIQGADLQLEGITKNQSLELDLRDRPAGEILVEILRRANPDRTATGPADPRQKLVYAIEPGPAGSPGRIIVTTRTAAERRGAQLPDIFLGTPP